MPITKKDKILIKNLFALKASADSQSEFFSKGWNVVIIYKLLKMLQVTGSVDHCCGSRR